MEIRYAHDRISLLLAFITGIESSLIGIQPYPNATGYIGEGLSITSSVSNIPWFSFRYKIRETSCFLTPFTSPCKNVSSCTYPGFSYSCDGSNFYLNISSLSRNMSGLNIMGIGTFDNGSMITATTVVRVYVPLKIVSLNPNVDQTIREHNTVEFTCIAESLPLATIVWFVDHSIQSNTTIKKEVDNLEITSTFRYTAMRQHNNKILTCTATSNMVTRNESVKLNITYGPGMTISHNASSVPIITTVGAKLESVYCSADCNPSCQYQWSKDGQERGKGRILSIESLTKSDHGIFICTGFNSVGSKNTNLTVTVQYGPGNIILSPDNNSYTLLELTLMPVITCDVDCRPICNKQWIAPNSKVINSSTLSLGKIQRTQAGIYRCFVNNTLNSSTSINISVNVTYGPGETPFFDPANTSIVKRSGDRLEPVRCTANCNPPCQYQWLTNDVRVVQNNTLIIQSLQKNDHGTYQCRAWNGFGNSYANLTVYVEYGPEETTLSPDNSTYTFQEQTSMPVITCYTDCRPSCTKYWVIPNGTIVQSPFLNITNIQRFQAGTYTCHVYNNVNSSKSHDVLVIVTYGASVSALETDTGTFTVNETQIINMTCKVDGVPHPKIVWTSKGDELRNLENVTSNVFISSCDKTGNYSCKATNYLGERNITKELFVRCRPRKISDQSTDEIIGLNNNEGLNITVALIAYPKPDIEWSFKNASLSVKNSLGIYKHTSSLMKPQVGQDDFGIYAISISNEIGHKTYAFSVVAERKPDPPIVISADCSQFSMSVLWNSSFNGGEKQLFFVKTTNSITKEERWSDKIDVGENPLYAFIEDLRQDTLYYVVVSANNSHGGTISEGIANCTTDQSIIDTSNLITVAAGAGSGSALFVVLLVGALVIVLRRRSRFQKTQTDKEPFQNNRGDDDDSGKDTNVIEMGCVHENSEDFAKHRDLIYANENGNKNNGLQSKPQKNKDGLIYADLDLAPVSTERRFIIRGSENKSTYAIIDLNKKATPLPSDDEEEETVGTIKE